MNILGQELVIAPCLPDFIVEVLRFDEDSVRIQMLHKHDLSLTVDVVADAVEMTGEDYQMPHGSTDYQDEVAVEFKYMKLTSAIVIVTDFENVVIKKNSLIMLTEEQLNKLNEELRTTACEKCREGVAA